MTTGLQVRNLNKRFGGIIAAKDIHLDLLPGDRKALIGPNGAGKTTFANLLTGVLKPSSGDILLDGKDLGGSSEAARVKAGIAKTFQITTLFRGMTLRENLRLPILERKGLATRFFPPANAFRDVEDEIDGLIGTFELEAQADTTIEELAYGQQRLAEMALTLALKPRILLLDEPAAGVPASDNHLISEAIARLPDDLAVLVIEHDMNLVFRIARSIIVLINGEILTEGSPAEIASNQTVRDLYLGTHHE